MRRLAAISTILGITSLTTSAMAVEAKGGWVSLFSGKDLSGWKALGDGKFEVTDGAIVCEGTNRQHGWLITDKEYDNFLLKLRFKWDRGNTGIQFRSRFDGKDMIGYQADLDLSNPSVTGTLWEQGGRRLLQNTALDCRTICDAAGWNEYEVLAVGDHIQLFVNGVKTADFHDARAAKGIIGFQAHAEQNNRVLYKDIRLLPLDGKAKWEPLLNGKDLTGWRAVGKEKWNMEEDRLIGRSGPEKGFGWLVNEREYSNFVMKFKFRWHGGNSGVQIRSWLVGEQMHGYQADIDPSVKGMTGGLYDEHQDGKLADAPPEVDAALKKDDWNTYEISAIGDRLLLFVNGMKSADVRHDRTKKGIIALQVHSGGPVHMEWKDLYILHVR